VRACRDSAIAFTRKIRAPRAYLSWPVKPAWTACTCELREQSSKRSPAYAKATAGRPTQKKSLPTNVDGAIGAILADLGIRSGGIQRHFYDRTHARIGRACHRRTDPRETDAPHRSSQPGYDGPPAKGLSDKSSEQNFCPESRPSALRRYDAEKC
jgi:hypothetical protein